MYTYFTSDSLNIKKRIPATALNFIFKEKEKHLFLVYFKVTIQKKYKNGKRVTHFVEISRIRPNKIKATLLFS